MISFNSYILNLSKMEIKSSHHSERNHLSVVHNYYIYVLYQVEHSVNSYRYHTGNQPIKWTKSIVASEIFFFSLTAFYRKRQLTPIHLKFRQIEPAQIGNVTRYFIGLYTASDWWHIIWVYTVYIYVCILFSISDRAETSAILSTSFTGINRCNQIC